MCVYKFENLCLASDRIQLRIRLQIANMASPSEVTLEVLAGGDSNLEMRHSHPTSFSRC